MTVVQGATTVTTKSAFEAVGEPMVGADLTNWRLHADTDAGGTVTVRYLSGEQADQWLAQVVAGTGTRWTLADLQGSVRLVTDDGGSVIDTISYDAFGSITESAPSVGGRLKYAGYEQDAWAGMYRAGDRFYLPGAQVWITQDPMGLGPDANPYRYAGNSPTNATDPSGRDWIHVGTDGAVYWAVQHHGYVSNTTTAYRYMGQKDGDNVRLADFYKSSATTVSLEGLKTEAWNFWNEFPDISAKSESSQFSHIKVVAGRLNNGTVISPYSATAHIAYAGAEGARDGAKIVANSLTFKMIPGLNAEASRLIEENGGAYKWAALAADVATGALTTAATMGAGSLLGNMGAAMVKAAGAAVPAYVSGPIAWVACKIVTAQRVGSLTEMPEQIAKQVYKVGEGLAKAWKLAGEKDARGEYKYPEAAEALWTAGMDAAGLVQDVRGLAGMMGTLYKEGPMGLWKSLSACFGAGTMLMTPHGPRAIEDLREGDLVLSRPDAARHGAVEAKRVEAVFRWTGRILELRVGGKVIRTTSEHPFFVEGEGWVEAAGLEEGDLLACQGQVPVMVQSVRDTGDHETVYNVCVEDFHTYFVVGDDWEFSVWAHNIGCQNFQAELGRQDVTLDYGRGRGGKSASGIVNAAERLATNPADFRQRIIGSLEKQGVTDPVKREFLANAALRDSQRFGKPPRPAPLSPTEAAEQAMDNGRERSKTILPKTGRWAGAAAGNRVYNTTIEMPSRSAAKDAATHSHYGKPRPTPPKEASRAAYDEQNKYKQPEHHPDSPYPEYHFHDAQKEAMMKKYGVNRHYSYPEGSE